MGSEVWQPLNQPARATVRNDDPSLCGTSFIVFIISSLIEDNDETTKDPSTVVQAQMFTST